VKTCDWILNMSLSPLWLATLQRVREYRRDTALQSLACSLQAATQIHDQADLVEARISGLRKEQQESGQAEPLDPARLRQIRQDRDNLMSQRAEVLRLRLVADAAVHQARANAAEKESEAQALRRLQERLDADEHQARRRHGEQSAMGIVVSLCNKQRSD